MKGSHMAVQNLLDRVCAALDVLVEIGRSHEGLFPSLIDRTEHTMLGELPPAIDGQRDGDRAPLGSNLIHDEPTLMTLYGLDRSAYTAAADDYLRRFATHCTDTESGLFPWGEHAYWQIEEDRPGNSFQSRDSSREVMLTHDHLRAVPLWLWRKLRDFHSGCVERFAEGLDNHWVDSEPIEYIRHACIDRKMRHPRSGTSCDFPRHSGFFICDWSFAYLQTGREDFLEQIRRMLDYWWEKRLPDGLCLSESRTHPGHILHRMKGVAQTLSLATSLLESARLLEARHPRLAAEMRRRAGVYTEGFLAAPHDTAAGLFVAGYSEETGALTPMAIWGSVYGKSPACYAALGCLCHYRLSGDRHLLTWAVDAGHRYAREEFPTGVQVPSMDAGLGLGLLADLFDITGDRAWLERGLRRAEEIVGIYFDDGVLPRGGAGIDWYESQMGPGFLLHGLARLALLAAEGRSCPLEADYTGR